MQFTKTDIRRNRNLEPLSIKKKLFCSPEEWGANQGLFSLPLASCGLRLWASGDSVRTFPCPSAVIRLCQAVSQTLGMKKKNGYLSRTGRAAFKHLQRTEVRIVEEAYDWKGHARSFWGVGAFPIMIWVLVKEMCSVCKNQFSYTLLICRLLSVYIILEFKRLNNYLKYVQSLCVQHLELQRSQ